MFSLLKNRVHHPIAVLTAIALFATLFSFASFNVQSVSAVAGDGATSNIQLLDTNANGKINRITFDIANPNGETWQLVGAAPHGLSVTQGGNDIEVSGVSLTTAATANPVTVQVDLNEGDADLQVDTNGVSTNAVELVYTQQTGDQTCTTCLNDSTDEELNTIATGDASAVNTENDAAAPIISSFTYQDTDADNQIDQVTAAFSETVTAASVLGANDLVFTNVGDFTGAAFGADATDLITGSVTSVAIPLGTESSASDTDEDSGTIAISTQNAFSLTDGTNTNTTLGAQTQVTFIDGATTPGKSPGFKEAINNPVIETGETITDEFQEAPLTDEEIQQLIDNTEVADTTPEEETATPEETTIPVEFGKDLMGNDLMMGSLVMVDGHPAIYYVDSQAMRHVFPRETVYRSWYGLDFSMVVMVDANTLASMELGDPVPYAPGTMIKIPSVPKVYLLTGNREMRHIASEQVAMDIFGAEWNTMIKDVSEAFFVQYTDLEMAITSADQVDLEGLMQAGPTIDSELN